MNIWQKPLKYGLSSLLHVSAGRLYHGLLPWITIHCTYTVSSMHIIHRTIQAGLFISDFGLTRLENLHHFSNLRDIDQSNAIRRRWNVAALFLSWRYEEVVTVTCVDWLRWWYNTRIMWFPLLVRKGVKNVNGQNPVQSKWKRQLVMKRN
jgi:hypothetical protein